MTLYLSRLILDPRNRSAAINLSRPYELHRTLLQAFPNHYQGGPGRVMFRREPIEQSTATEAKIIVQSDREPDWIQATQKYPKGLLLAPPESGILPTSFAVGTILRFLLRANPTTRRCRLSDGTRDERKQRPRHALYREDDQLAWLLRQGANQGFELMPSDEAVSCETGPLSAKYDVMIHDEGTIFTGKRTKTGVSRHHSVLFEGRLRVIDSLAFENALCGGIGPAKAFGFGLLSIAPVHA